MRRLNYNDLLALVIEYDIEALQEQLKQKEQQRHSANGLEVVDATDAEVAKMHRR